MRSLFDVLFGNEEKEVAAPPTIPIATQSSTPPVIYNGDGLLVRLEGESTGAYIERMLSAKPRPPGIDDFIKEAMRGDAETQVAPEDDPYTHGPQADATYAAHEKELAEFCAPEQDKSDGWPADPRSTAWDYTVSNNIKDSTFNAIIQIESAGNPKAKARTSTASGLAQFIQATWLATVKRYRPDWLKGKTTAQVLAMRFDPPKAIEMLARFTEENRNFLKRYKIAPTDGALYLAHFAGPRTAANIMGYGANEPVSRYVSAAAIRANPSILKGKTCGQVASWAAVKMAKAAASSKDWVTLYIKKGGVE